MRQGMNVTQGHVRGRVFALALCVLAALLTGPLKAAPPAERLEVVAVADDSAPRILLRWRAVEGIQRYAAFDVMRREAGSAAFTLQNLDPIEPLTEVQEIQDLFVRVGNEDALQWIQESFGSEYAVELLLLQDPNAPEISLAQRRYLPEQNYMAAVALGLGYLDENVTPGTTYVYELWGLDGAGAPAERLGRASATAGTYEPHAGAQNPTCIDPGDARGHQAAFLRWDPSPDEWRGFGYEVLRTQANPDGSCPPMAPGAPDVVRASSVTVLPPKPGRQTLGSNLFAAQCQSCHPGGRDDAQVAGSTLRDFYRRQIGDAANSATPHDIPALNSMTPDELDAVFEYVQAFNFRDDGSDTPLDPVQLRQSYCYQMLPRNLFGDLGTPTTPVPCEVLDRDAPEQPALIQSQRVLDQGHEVCEISWERNDESVDGTESYEIYRVLGVPRDLNLDRLPPSWRAGTLLQSSVTPGSRATFIDTSVQAGDAGTTFFYAARALDAAGNPSPLSGFVPCVPRDLVPPGRATLTLRCCEENPGDVCRDTTFDERWQQEEGDLTILTGPDCPPQIDIQKPNDAWGVRVYRSFDGVKYVPGPEVTTSPWSPDFEPMIDSKIWYKVRTIDPSGNFGAFSDPASFLFKLNAPLPAPTIKNVLLDLQDDGDGEDWIRIQFYSLSPKALLGLSLWTSYLVDGEDPDPNIPPGYVDHFGQPNFGSQPATNTDSWVVKPAAQALENTITNVEPASGRFLTYDPATSLYTMKVKVGESNNVVLHLHAIGWGGVPGKVKPYAWDGFGIGDLELSWPHWKRQNPRQFDGVNASLLLTPQPAGIDVFWFTEPAGCGLGTDMPFIVFRRREGSRFWQQVSPLIACQSPSHTSVKWTDPDAEPDTWYTYTVVRYDRNGEFSFQYGPDTLCHLPAGPTCSGPQP